MSDEERILKIITFGQTIETESNSTLFNKDMEIIKNALKKQIPTEPIIDSWKPALCPFCGRELSESTGDGEYHHYITKKICDCGQKLDWHSVT